MVQAVRVNKKQPLDEEAAKERDLVQKELGGILRRRRIEQHMTIEMVAEKAELHPNYVGSVERGERNLSIFNLWRLASSLGLTVAQLTMDMPPRAILTSQATSATQRSD